jgi:hypothetical protein
VFWQRVDYFSNETVISIVLFKATDVYVIILYRIRGASLCFIGQECSSASDRIQEVCVRTASEYAIYRLDFLIETHCAFSEELKAMGRVKKTNSSSPTSGSAGSRQPPCISNKDEDPLHLGPARLVTQPILSQAFEMEASHAKAMIPTGEIFSSKRPKVLVQQRPDLLVKVYPNFH